MPRVPSAAAAHIGSRIQAARKSRGLTQDQLAAATGIDSSNIRAYEAGRALTALASLVRIAEVLDVAAGELLDGVTSDMFAPRGTAR